MGAGVFGPAPREKEGAALLLAHAHAPPAPLQVDESVRQAILSEYLRAGVVQLATPLPQATVVSPVQATPRAPAVQGVGPTGTVTLPTALAPGQTVSPPTGPSPPSHPPPAGGTSTLSGVSSATVGSTSRGDGGSTGNATVTKELDSTFSDDDSELQSLEAIMNYFDP